MCIGGDILCALTQVARVPTPGLEPGRLAAPRFKRGASAISSQAGEGSFAGMLRPPTCSLCRLVSSSCAHPRTRTGTPSQATPFEGAASASFARQALHGKQGVTWTCTRLDSRGHASAPLPAVRQLDLGSHPGGPSLETALTDLFRAGEKSANSLGKLGNTKDSNHRRCYHQRTGWDSNPRTESPRLPV